MKWYNVELFDAQEICHLKAFLKEAGLEFESSGCGTGTHFEIFASEMEAAKVNIFLEKRRKTKEF